MPLDVQSHCARSVRQQAYETIKRSTVLNEQWRQFKKCIYETVTHLVSQLFVANATGTLVYGSRFTVSDVAAKTFITLCSEIIKVT